MNKLLVTFYVLLFMVFAVKAAVLDDKTVKNFSYKLTFRNMQIKMKDGYFSQVSKDSFFQARVQKYTFFTLEAQKAKIVPVVISYKGVDTNNEEISELTVLLAKGKEVITTNNILLGSNLKVEKLECNLQKGGYNPLEHTVSRDKLIITLQGKKDDRDYRSLFTIADDKLYPEKYAPLKPDMLVKKPAIYLYPKKERMVEVKLKIKGEIVKTIPEYKDKWLYKVNEKGLIDERYRYLFYEVSLKSPFVFKQGGWVVAYDNLENWMDTTLTQLGFNSSEKKDFKEYWLQNLSSVPYIEIRLLDSYFLNKVMEVSIFPEPDEFRRFIFYFRPLYRYREIMPPCLKGFRRKGFSALEWGGILER